MWSQISLNVLLKDTVSILNELWSSDGEVASNGAKCGGFRPLKGSELFPGISILAYNTMSSLYMLKGAVVSFFLN